MASEYCVVIPAIKKSAVIPDQLVKKLAGITLIQRAIDTARGVAAAHDIFVVTDSDEIRLICERNAIGCFYDPGYAVPSLDIVSALEPALLALAKSYDNIIIYRASSPLLVWSDIQDAFSHFIQKKADCLVTVKSLQLRLWQEQGTDIWALLHEESSQPVYAETRALIIMRSAMLQAVASPSPVSRQNMRVIPYFLHDRAIEITSYQDWWICEKLLQRKHVVFVVAGYLAIGMGHVYRSLMLAHEIADHKITFVCTKESELAAVNIAARDYRTRLQSPDEGLAEAVLKQRPHMVINDMLATDPEYMRTLKDQGLTVVNFEDEGQGTAFADLVVNALYERGANAPAHFLCGPDYFCLRDEFLQAQQNSFRPHVQRVLITFGGTDPADYTRSVLKILVPLCLKKGIHISVVTGPGYVHKESLARYILQCNEKAVDTQAFAKEPMIVFSHASNIMSRMMEGVDCAVCAAGRTVYELAHMRVPSIVISQHEREDMHTFARENNGFLSLGVMQDAFDSSLVLQSFLRLLDKEFRYILFERMGRFDFTANKEHVVQRITALLDTIDASNSRPGGFR